MTVIPLSDVADTRLRALAHAAASPRLAALDGATLLGERAMLAGYRIPGTISAGGGCRLYETRDGAIALNLARPDDRDLLPALFECDTVDDIPAAVAACHAHDLVARGRLLGLAIAAVDEADAPAPAPAVEHLAHAPPAPPPARTPARARAPTVVDLSALWAGPLAAHLLTLAGASVIRVESPARPDAMRHGDPAFFALLNQDKASVALDLRCAADRTALIALIARADIVIEAARPRALLQLGIDADAIVRASPGLTWITITAHGARGAAANHVGFGDDTAVAAGLTAALRAATGRIGFVGDAIADPLTGIRAAGIAWEAWASGKGGRYGLSMRGVVAEALEEAEKPRPFRRSGLAMPPAWPEQRGALFIRNGVGEGHETGDVSSGHSPPPAPPLKGRGDVLDQTLTTWATATGAPFPPVQRRPIGTVRPLGADTRTALAPC